MILFPAIDLYEGKAVRLLRGDYQNMTVYSDDPAAFAEDFARRGATHIHIVDLEGAKSGTTPNLRVIKELLRRTNLFTEVGGGIRDMRTVETYLEAGVSRVILGTAAVTDPAFLREALSKYGERIAVGVDVKDDYVAIRGWMEQSARGAVEFCKELEQLGAANVICTDISKDGAMQGAGYALYEKLLAEVKLPITASGGVSDLEDVRRLNEMGLYGAIIGKAYYTGAISLEEALEAAK
ncbi:MAG: 1-(5-phosphoribosyl)-5-[Oscillospiraceae bacterium]|nr:1-(5-phosphoribosyl)-5-[(5-phosphoribosylamino)methylideneamino]imidazole-4-carboxamide isomerase [Oscillospiraceae bacterium]